MASSQIVSGNTFGNSNNVHQGNNIYNDCQVIQAGNDSDNAYLRHLSQTDPRLDKKRIIDTKGPLLRDSYCWIFDHQDYRQWLDAQSGILWIKGDPGKGKTMLLCGIIENLEENGDEENDTAYFFCQATDTRINTAAAILGGLTFYLARRKKSLLSHIKERHISPGKSLFDGPNGWVTICDIFEAVIHDSALSRIVLVVDALDECATDRDSFLRLVVRTSSKVKWLLSSRNLEDIERRLLSKDSVNPLSLELKENAESVSQAVHSYIDHCVAHMEIIQEDKELETKVRETLQRKANDTFLWVALAIQQLQEAMKWEVLRILDQMPEGLQSLYQLMMNQIQNHPGQRRDLCIKLLSLVTMTFQPLHLGELSCLWQMEAGGPQSQEDFRIVAQLCGSFLTVKDDIIYFIHQSAKDFVLEQGLASKHYYIFKSSMDSMSGRLRRDIYDLKSPGTLIRDIATPPQDPLACIRYQCIFWIDHLLASTKEERDRSIQDCGDIHVFFTKVYLYWLEALSLLRSMDHPVAKMYELDALIQKEGPSSLRELIKDAIRFLQYNRIIIATVPLQIYFSAVLFAPECSLIRKAFISNVYQGIPLILNRPNHWGPDEQPLIGHEGPITSLEFSPTSQRLLSSSADGTARVWDIKTGSCQRILYVRDHDDEFGIYFHVKFSPDSKQIVSWDPEKICLWNTDTGEKMYTLQDNKRFCESAAFASDSKLLASVYFGMSVCIWCTETGNLLLQSKYIGGGTRFPYSSTPKFAAFSPDLKRVAFTESSAVTIWDIEAAKKVCSFPHGWAKLTEITFSHFSELLASVETPLHYGSKSTINVWCITTARKLKSYQGEVCDSLLEGKLMFTSNNELVITTRQGLYRWQFQSSSDFEKLVFISDTEPFSITDLPNHMLFSARMDLSDNIHVSQLHSSGDSMVIPKENHHSVGEDDNSDGEDDQCSDFFRVDISPDSSVVASWSVGSTTVTLQRTDTGKRFAKLKGHRETITAIAFSPDSSTVISCDDKRILRLWKLATGECIDVLSMMELESTNQYSCVNDIVVAADMKIIACLQPRDIFILHKNNEKEYRCIAQYSAPYFFKPLTSGSFSQIAISSNSVFVTWRTDGEGNNKASAEHWRVNINESIDVSHMPYRYSLGKREREQAEKIRYTIAEDEQLQWRDVDGSGCFWVTKNEERVLWIPEEFRPQQEWHWDSVDSIVAIRVSWDLTIILDFSKVVGQYYNMNKDGETKLLKKRGRNSNSEAAIVKQPKTLEEFKNV